MFIYNRPMKSKFHYSSTNQLILAIIILSANTFIFTNSIETQHSNKIENSTAIESTIQSSIINVKGNSTATESTIQYSTINITENSLATATTTQSTIQLLNTNLTENSNSTATESTIQYSTINITENSLATGTTTQSTIQPLNTNVTENSNSTATESTIQYSTINITENSLATATTQSNIQPSTTNVTVISNLTVTELDSYCKTLRTCTQCTSIPTCNWSIEKQICVDNSISSQLQNITVCPKLSVNFTVLNNFHNKHITQNLTYSINIKILNDVKNFKTFLSKNNIICKVDDLTVNATLINDFISCNITPVPYESVDHIVLKMNPLHIIYFSIYANDTEIKFDNPQDQYTSYYGLNCPRSDCTTSFWEDESNQFYCEWCSKNEACPVKMQQSKCDIRQTNGYHLQMRNEFSEIEVRGSGVQIEYFEPTYGLYMGGIPLKIIVRGHWILNENRQMNITVAGRQCTDVNMSNNEILTCTIAESSDSTDRSVGPVIIMYSSTINYVLKSRQMFRFIYPKITSVSPAVVPVFSNEMLKITGEYLNVMPNVKVYINDVTECIISRIEDEYIECSIRDISDIEPYSPGEVAVTFDDMIIRNSSMDQLMFVGLPMVNPEQMFSGISSGGTKLVVYGRFPFIENATFCVFDIYDKKHCGDCTLPANHTIALLYQVVCYSPNLTETNMLPTVDLPVKFDIYYDNRPIELISPYDISCYTYHEDPDFIDFGTDIENRYISINGDFGYSNYYADEIRIPIEQGNCDLVSVTDYEMICQTPTNDGVYAASRTKQLTIYVGKNIVGVALRRPRPPYMNNGRLEFFITLISKLYNTATSIFNIL